MVLKRDAGIYDLMRIVFTVQSYLILLVDRFPSFWNLLCLCLENSVAAVEKVLSQLYFLAHFSIRACRFEYVRLSIDAAALES
jgi:hypothetical protein